MGGFPGGEVETFEIALRVAGNLAATKQKDMVLQTSVRENRAQITAFRRGGQDGRQQREGKSKRSNHPGDPITGDVKRETPRGYARCGPARDAAGHGHT